MKSKQLLWLLLTVIIAGVLLFPAQVLADDNRYVEIRRVIINAEVLPDGSVAVEEERSYFFGGGQFRGADQWFYFSGDVGYEDISVREGDTPYSHVDTFPTTEPGTFSTRFHDDHFVLDYSFNANHEEKTFIIEYVLTDAVTVHEDVAEIYHQFIGDEWDQTTQYALVNLWLPDGASEDDIKAWGHGPLHGEVTIEGSDHISWVVEGLSPRRYLEVRTVFPPELVPDSTNKTGEEALEAIMAEEDRWARRADLEQAMHRIQWIFGPILLIILIIYSVITFRKVKAGTNAYEGDYYRELPGEYPPAIAGYLMRHAKTDTEDFTATIMDLARRKFIRIEEVTTRKGLLKRESTDYLVVKLENDAGLAPYEKRLMDFLFKQIAPTSDWANKVTRKEYAAEASSGNETALTFDDIKNYSKKNRITVKNFFQNWKNEIQIAAQQHNFFDYKMSGLQYRGVVFGVILVLIGVALVMFTELYLLTGILWVSGALFVVLMIAAGKPFTGHGADQCSKWKAFKRFLQHFSSMDQSTIPSLIVWEHYLVYAVVLGVAKEVMKQLTVVFPDLEEQSRRMGMSWYAMGMMGRGTGFTNTFDRMSDSLNSTMRDSYKAAFSSSASRGGGGGFSGGGGGGSGGGGGGFR